MKLKKMLAREWLVLCMSMVVGFATAAVVTYLDYKREALWLIHPEIVLSQQQLKTLPELDSKRYAEFSENTKERWSYIELLGKPEYSEGAVSTLVTAGYLEPPSFISFCKTHDFWFKILLYAVVSWLLLDLIRVTVWSILTVKK